MIRKKHEELRLTSRDSRTCCSILQPTAPRNLHQAPQLRGRWAPQTCRQKPAEPPVENMNCWGMGCRQQGCNRDSLLTGKLAFSVGGRNRRNPIRKKGYPQNCSDDDRWSFSLEKKQCSQLQFGGFPLPETTLQLACPATSRPVLHRSPALRTPHRCSSGRSRESPKGTWYSIPAYLHRGEWNPMGVCDNTRVEESECSVQNIGMGGMGSKS